MKTLPDPANDIQSGGNRGSGHAATGLPANEEFFLWPFLLVVLWMAVISLLGLRSQPPPGSGRRQPGKSRHQPGPVTCLREPKAGCRGFTQHVS
jgi:hypothetical protein